VRINSYDIVINFELDESIVLTLGPSLIKLQKNLGGQLISINAPEDAPPPLPRIVLKFQDSLLKLGLDRFSITSKPPSHVTSNIAKSSKFALQRASSIIKDFVPQIPHYEWCGIITEIEFPSESCKSGLEATTPVFDRLITIKREDRDLAAFQFQFGIKDNLHFTNYIIGGFESRKIQMESKTKKSFIPIRPEDHPITECGIRIVLDINNKPGGATENILNDIEIILDKINNLSKTFQHDLNLEGILS
jgi:hypothetical protein